MLDCGYPRQHAGNGPYAAAAAMFAVLFGLSMDYEVFLVSRIAEERERLGDAPAGVAEGLAPTARVIMAAASIILDDLLIIVMREGMTAAERTMFRPSEPSPRGDRGGPD
jgi:MMPL family